MLRNTSILCFSYGMGCCLPLVCCLLQKKRNRQMFFSVKVISEQVGFKSVNDPIHKDYWSCHRGDYFKDCILISLFMAIWTVVRI